MSYPASSSSREGICVVCRRSVPIVNYARVRDYEVGYLGRHWRPGIALSSKCRGSFGHWVGKRLGGGRRLGAQHAG